MNRYKPTSAWRPVGWRNESLRHSLAAKGLTNKYAFAKKKTNIYGYTDFGTIISIDPSKKKVNVFGADIRKEEYRKYLDDKGNLVPFKFKSTKEMDDDFLKIESTADRKERLQKKRDFKEKHGVYYPELDNEDEGYTL